MTQAVMDVNMYSLFTSSCQ